MRPKPIGQRRHEADQSCPDGSWKPLKRGQKANLSMLAAEGFKHQKVMGCTLEEWRHEMAVQACGYRISEARQEHWSDLRAAFLDLAGQPEKAYRTHVRSVDNKRRVALYKLEQECAARGLDVSYPATICRRQFRLSLEEASAKQLWCLVFTVRNRRKAK